MGLSSDYRPDNTQFVADPSAKIPIHNPRSGRRIGIWRMDFSTMIEVPNYTCRLRRLRAKMQQTVAVSMLRTPAEVSGIDV